MREVNRRLLQIVPDFCCLQHLEMIEDGVELSGVLFGFFFREFKAGKPCDFFDFFDGYHLLHQSDFGLDHNLAIDNVPRWTILSVLPRLFTGQHIAHPAVRVERTAKIEIHTEHKRVVHADGEHLGDSPLSVAICPKALNIVLPPV